MNLYREQMKSKNSFLLRIKTKETQAALKHTQKLLKRLKAAPFRGFPQENAELENGLNMATAALLFLQRAAGGKWDRAAWLDLMRQVTARHEILWLARNRSGGLHESAGALRKFMENDPDAWKNR